MCSNPSFLAFPSFSHSPSFSFAARTLQYFYAQLCITLSSLPLNPLLAVYLSLRYFPFPYTSRFMYYRLPSSISFHPIFSRFNIFSFPPFSYSYYFLSDRMSSLFFPSSFPYFLFILSFIFIPSLIFFLSFPCLLNRHNSSLANVFSYFISFLSYLFHFLSHSLTYFSLVRPFFLLLFPLLPFSSPSSFPSIPIPYHHTSP